MLEKHKNSETAQKVSKPGEDERYHVVGKPLPRHDAWAKVSGQTIYAGDHKVPEMLYAKVLRSEYADMAPGTDFWRQYEEKGLIGPDDWKRNHRIYEFPTGLPKDYLLDAQQRAYEMYIEEWKDWGNLRELLGHVFLNPHNRKIILRNLLLNPKTIEVVRGLGKVEHQY